MKALIKYFSFSVFPCLLILGGIEVIFRMKTAKVYRFPSEKQWAHRFNKSSNIGKIKNLEEKGLEIDIFYYPKKDRFYVLHDYKQNPGGNLSLDLFLRSISASRKYVWLDFKNLTTANAEKAGARLKNKLEEYELLERSLVESQNGYALGLLSALGLNCSYWIHTYRKSRLFWPRNIVNKINVILGDFIAISMPARQYGKKVKSMYKKFPILLFNIDNATQRDEALSDKKVKIIL